MFIWLIKHVRLVTGMRMRGVGDIIGGVASSAIGMHQAKNTPENAFKSLTPRTIDPQYIDKTFPHYWEVRDKYNDIQNLINEHGASFKAELQQKVADEKEEFLHNNPNFEVNGNVDVPVDVQAEIIKSLERQEKSLMDISQKLTTTTDGLQKTKETVKRKNQESAKEGDRKKVKLEIDYQGEDFEKAEDDDDDDKDESDTSEENLVVEGPKVVAKWSQIKGPKREHVSIYRFQDKPDAMVLENIFSAIDAINEASYLAKYQDDVFHESLEAEKAAKVPLTLKEYNDELAELDKEIKDNIARDTFNTSASQFMDSKIGLVKSSTPQSTE